MAPTPQGEGPIYGRVVFYCKQCGMEDKNVIGEIIFTL